MALGVDGPTPYSFKALTAYFQFPLHTSDFQCRSLGPARVSLEAPRCSHPEGSHHPFKVKGWWATIPGLPGPSAGCLQSVFRGEVRSRSEDPSGNQAQLPTMVAHSWMHLPFLSSFSTLSLRFQDHLPQILVLGPTFWETQNNTKSRGHVGMTVVFKPWDSTKH